MKEWWENDYSHNPYFNRWFSAMYEDLLLWFDLS